MKELESPTILVGRDRDSSTFCSARIGVPAATRPTRGRLMTLLATSCVTGASFDASEVLEAWGTIFMVRGFFGSLSISPNCSRTFRCIWTVEGDARLTAVPISLTEGG